MFKNTIIFLLGAAVFFQHFVIKNRVAIDDAASAVNAIRQFVEPYTEPQAEQGKKATGMTAEDYLNSLRNK